MTLTAHNILPIDVLLVGPVLPSSLLERHPKQNKISSAAPSHLLAQPPDDPIVGVTVSKASKAKHPNDKSRHPTDDSRHPTDHSNHASDNSKHQNDKSWHETQNTCKKNKSSLPFL